MSLRYLRRARVRESLAAVAIAAYLLVALVPVGFMPSVDGLGWLKLCSARGTVTIPGNGDPQSPTHDAGGGCAFALAMSGAAPPPARTLVIATTAMVASPSTPVPVHHVATNGPLRSQSPRGPPPQSFPA